MTSPLRIALLVFVIAAFRIFTFAQETPAAAASTVEAINTQVPPVDATLHGRDRALEFAGRFHPVLVHFPIALLIVAAFADFLSLFRIDSIFRNASRFCLLLGAPIAVAAALLGWANAAYGQWPGEESIVEIHRWLGTAAAAIAVLTAALSEAAIAKESRSLRITSRVTLYAGAALVGLAGHFGAALVYGIEYFKF